MTRKQLIKKYNCNIFKDACFDSGSKYWVAISNDGIFDYEDGWTLKELEDKLKQYSQ